MIHDVGYGQFDGVGDRLDLYCAARIALGFQFRFEFVAPLDDQEFRWIGLEDFAGVGDLAIGDSYRLSKDSES